MQKLTDVYGGALLYHRFTRKKPDTFFALLMDADDELNYYAVQHLQRYAELNGFSAAEIICGGLQDKVKRLAGDRYAVHCLSEKKARQLLGYVLLKMTNCYIPIIDNMRIVSLRHCHSGIDLLNDIGFFDKEYIIWNRLLYRGDAYDKLIRSVPFAQAGL